MALPSPLSTAADYINGRILRHACQLRPGYTAGPELQQDVLQEWLALVDEWNLDRDLSLNKPEYTHAITGPGFNGNNRDYQIGPTAADWVQPRPVKLLKANLIFTTTVVNSRVPIDLLSWEDWGSISVLAVPASQVATTGYYEALFPNGVLHLWPPINANSVELWQNGALVAPATLATVVAGTFPPGYENAFVYTLAERCQYLCTKEMGKLNPKIAAWAYNARRKIRNANAGNPLAYGDYQQSSDMRHGSNSGNVTLIGTP